jgi:hypothetical protein
VALTRLPATLTYFAIVFGTGFLLGPIRVLWLVPQVGERYAELMELPIMLLVSLLAARWVVGRMGQGASVRDHLAVGLTALGLVVLLEITLVLTLRGMSIAGYIAGRDPVAGAAYLITLLVFGLAPAWFGHRARLAAGVPRP